MFSNTKLKTILEILNFYVLRNDEHSTLVLAILLGKYQNEWWQCSIWTAGSKATTNNTKTVLLGKTIKMNGHSVVFGQLVQKLQQTTPKQFYSARRSKRMVTV